MITLRQFEPGEVIIRENDVGETAYVIEQGKVEVTKELAGKRVHLGYVASGEPFGEMSMIDDKPRSATVTAIEQTLVREIHRDAFLEGLQTDPEIAVKLLKVLFERLRESHVKILQLQQGAPDDFQPLLDRGQVTPQGSGPAVTMDRSGRPGQGGPVRAAQ